MTQETLLDNNIEEDVIDPTKDYYDEYVGEGKKYANEKELAKAYFHAESALRNRERRLDEVRSDLSNALAENKAKARLEDLIAQLDKPRPPASNNETPVNEDTRKPFDPDQLDSLISTRLMAHDLHKKEQENMNAVKAKLTERYGRNYQNALKDMMDQLDLTEGDVNALARKSPAALFRTLGLEEVNRKEQFDAPPRSNIQFKPKVESPHKPLSYYQELRKKDKMLYHNPKIANQMDKDMQALGEAFFDVPE